MDNYISPIKHVPGHFFSSSKDQIKVVNPARFSKNFNKILTVWVEIFYFIVTVSNGMNIGNIKKFDLTVVIFFTLKTLSCQFVAPGYIVSPSIKNLDI